MFTNRPQALGALYAFEHQQPATAKSKLAGLRKHYNLAPSAEVYFDIHQDDEDEPAGSPSRWTPSPLGVRAVASRLPADGKRPLAWPRRRYAGD